MRLRLLFILSLINLLLAMPAAAQQDQVVYATAQRFENGLMIWRSDTGQIWALSNNGLAFNFPTEAYGHLPDNPIFGTPPSRLRPIFGFGKVWGNYETVRHDLGWPTLTEIGFNMPVRNVGGTFYLTQLDQTVIQINPDLTWTRIGASDNPQPSVLGFRATPNPMMRGEPATLSWQVSGVDSVLIEVYDVANSQFPVDVIDNLPLIGTLTYRPAINLNADLRFIIWGVNHSHHPVLVTLWERVVQSELVIEVRQSPETTTQAAFQQYENGFMIWQADTGTVMVLGGRLGGQVLTFSVNSYASWSGVSSDFYIPNNRVRPINAFGKVWYEVQQVRDMIGYAVEPERVIS